MGGFVFNGVISKDRNSALGFKLGEVKNRVLSNQTVFTAIDIMTNFTSSNEVKPSQDQ